MCAYLRKVFAFFSFPEKLNSGNTDRQGPNAIYTHRKYSKKFSSSSRNRRCPLKTIACIRTNGKQIPFGVLRNFSRIVMPRSVQLLSIKIENFPGEQTLKLKDHFALNLDHYNRKNVYLSQCIFYYLMITFMLKYVLILYTSPSWPTCECLGYNSISREISHIVCCNCFCI